MRLLHIAQHFHNSVWFDVECFELVMYNTLHIGCVREKNRLSNKLQLPRTHGYELL